MTQAHLDRVLEIENSSFSQPYSREIFEEELALDIAHPSILKVGEILVGFLDYWLIPQEIHLISIATHPAWRKKGLATFLMEHLEKEANRQGVGRIFLDVRKSNIAAIHLYEKFGFKKIGVRRHYYSENNEDALVMEKKFEK